MKRKANSGQLTVEAVLILTLLVGITMAIAKTFREKNYLASMAEKPWTYVAGMIENGIWRPVEDGKRLHPNHTVRHGTPQGDNL